MRPFSWRSDRCLEVLYSLVLVGVRVPQLQGQNEGWSEALKPVIPPKFKALPGPRLELSTHLGPLLVNLAKGLARAGVKVDAVPLLGDRKGPFAEVAVVGVLGEMMETFAAPAQQIIRVDQDASLACVATGTTPRAVERRARDGVDRRIHRTGQVWIKRQFGHGRRVVDWWGGLVNLADGADQC